MDLLKTFEINMTICFVRSPCSIFKIVNAHKLLTAWILGTIFNMN